LLASATHARPFIFHRSIVNAASFTPQGLPNGAIARGAIFSIFGRDLGPAVGVSAPALPLQTTLAAVSVRVCRGTNDCISAYPLYVSAGQINAVMPSTAPIGAVNVIVRYNNEDGNFSPAQVTDTAFGTFAVSSGGFGPGIITNTNYAVNSAQSTMRPGQTVIAWGTGLGAALNADNVAPQVGDLPVDVEIWVGGIAVTRKLYSGRSAEFPGLDQIAFDIPANAPTGCYVPVVLRTAKRVTSNSATIAISADGSACSDPSSPFAAARPGGRTGIVLLNRLNTSSSALNVNFSADMISAVFQDEQSGPWHFNRMYSLPSPGTCITSVAAHPTLNATLIGNLAASGTRLDAGEHITVVGPATSAEAEILPAARNFYGGTLGNDYGLQPLMSLFFGNGSTRVSSTGGPNVGAFQLDLTPPPALTFTDPNLTLNRGSNTDVRWSGGDPQGLTLLLGFGVSNITASTAMFACIERTSQGHIAVPDWVVAHFPSPTGPADTLLGIFALPANATRFTATGLDNGLGLFINGQLRAIDIR
jgi:uncharacterized protein (TIGR03437 family)